MQLTVHKDTALHSCVFVLELKWFEPDHERRNHITGVGRKDRHGYHFNDGSITGLGIFLDVTDLLRIRQFVQGELRFGFGVQLSNIVRIQRLNDRAFTIEEAIKSCVKRLRRLLRGRLLPFH